MSYALAAFGSRSARLLAGVALVNLVAWAAALLVFAHHPLLLGSAVLAYSLGLRHAVDADHIAAIDNATRKLMQQGKRPLSAGLFFSLGHSTVVIALSLALALLAGGGAAMTFLADAGSLFGTAVSAVILLGLAACNIAVLVGIWRNLRRAGQRDFDPVLAGNGLAGRLFSCLFKLVDHGWHMYPIGLLFGLGFDTATEIAVLGLSAAQGSKGLALWTIMLFPLLFTAAMSLVDTADNLMMVKAYDWAFVNPLRKLYYNLTMTGISVAVALCIGGVEALDLLRAQSNPSGAFWRGVAWLGGNFTPLGYGVIALFAGCWAVSWLIFRLKDSAPAWMEAAE